MEQRWGTSGKMISCKLFSYFSAIMFDKQGVWDSVALKLTAWTAWPCSQAIEVVA